MLLNAVINSWDVWAAVLAGDCVHIYGWPSGNITGPDNQEIFFTVCQFSWQWKAKGRHTRLSAESLYFQKEWNIGEGRWLRMCLSTSTRPREEQGCRREIKDLEMRRQRYGDKDWCCNYRENYQWVRNTSTYIRDMAVSLKYLLHNCSMLTGHLCRPPWTPTHASLARREWITKTIWIC